MPRSLSEWLEYQQQTHPNSIELGLSRVREVWQRLGSPRPGHEVIIVAGTNGKGSTVALLESMLAAGGHRVGCYTSPHLLRYNERLRIAGLESSDAAWVAAFERIEQARGDLPLTYFEFGTLAAIDLLARAEVDVAILEVGLGGRLDAVNIIDADVALISTVDLDHTEWLGPDRDSIGREKAGISRDGRPCLIGERQPPAGLLQAADAAGALIRRLGIDFDYARHAQGWDWWTRSGLRLSLPVPTLLAPVQFDNAANAIAALWQRDLHRPQARPWLQADAVAQALQQVHVPARLQCLDPNPNGPRVYLDVAHNPQAAHSLADWLGQQTAQSVPAIYAALADKDVVGVIARLAPQISHWHLVGLDGVTPRGMPAAALAASLRAHQPQAQLSIHPDLDSALAAAQQQAIAEQAPLVLAFGSFFLASQVLTRFPSVS